MPKRDSGRLDSWKEIAAFLGRDVTTVVRWERQKGLPVHRVPGGKRQAVFAFRHEIEAWLSGAGPEDSQLKTAQEAVAHTATIEIPHLENEEDDPALQAQNLACGQDSSVSEFKTLGWKAVFAHSRILMLLVATGVFLTVLAFTLRLETSPSFPRVLRYTPVTHDKFPKGSFFEDGAHIYFGETLAEKTKIEEVSINGGEIVDLPMAFKWPYLVNIFPRGSGLLVADRSAPHLLFWKIPLRGGSPQPIAHFQSLDMAWSPDGEQVVSIEDDGHSLVVGNADHTTARKIFSKLPGEMTWPRWSPDGKALRFTTRDLEGNSSYSLWEINSDGSGLHSLLPRFNHPSRYGSWTPDGKYYVFDSFRNGRWDIWALREKRGWFSNSNFETVRLTDGPLVFSSALPGVNGKQLFVLAGQEDAELVRYDWKSQTFAPYLAGISAVQPDVSRDEKWVAYITFPEGTLWRSRTDGSEKLQLTFAPMEADSPHWSPDAQRIAFRGSLPGQPKKILVLSREGGIAQELAALPTEQEEGVPTWSPDGNSLVFGELRWHPDKIAIHIMDLRTKQLSTVPGSEGLWTPRWSPDGRYLLALTANPSSFNSKSLMIFDFHAHAWKELVNHSIGEPVWSHDGRFIYFNHPGDPKEMAVFRVRLSNGKIQQVVSLLGFSPEGTALNLAPDDSPLLSRNARNTEIYALDVEW